LLFDPSRVALKGPVVLSRNLHDDTIVPAQSSNGLLASLPAAVFSELAPHLQTIDLVHERVLARAGDTITHVYFPLSGVISLVVGLAGGEMIEVAMVGRTSVMGAFEALEDRVALSSAIVQSPGTASLLEVERFRRLAERHPGFGELVKRHEQFLFIQAQQSAACNASHGVEARLARFLLQIRDLSGRDTLQLTQEFLAQMIGARRNSVSLVAHTLQQAGVIRYSRGHLKVCDLARLRNAACECYATVRAHHERLLLKS
jgi:CRP-like cAMP-binding protein